MHLIKPFIRHFIRQFCSADMQLTTPIFLPALFFYSCSLPFCFSILQACQVAIQAVDLLLEAPMFGKLCVNPRVQGHHLYLFYLLLPTLLGTYRIRVQIRRGVRHDCGNATKLPPSWDTESDQLGAPAIFEILKSLMTLRRRQRCLIRCCAVKVLMLLADAVP